MRRLIVGLLALVVWFFTVGQANADLIGYWPLNGNANDSSGNAHNGTVYGATATQDRFGNPSGAMLFNGSASYIDIPDATALDPTNAITFTAWFNVSAYLSSGNYWPAVLKKSTYPNQQDGYALEAVWVNGVTGHMSASVVLPAVAPGVQTISDSLIDTNTWYFGAGVYDGSQVTLYVGPYGGSLTSNSQNGSGTILNSLGDLWIGADPSNPGPARTFNGAIDDVRIYNSALSPSGINALYTNTPEPSTFVLLGGGAFGLLAYAWRRRNRV